MASPAQIYAQQPGVQELAPKQGVLKRILHAGPSQGGSPPTPSLGDQVEVSYIMKVGSGLPTAGREVQRGEMERYSVGTGQVCRGLDVVLCSMQAGETATARLKHAYAGVQEAREVEITLLQIHSTQILAGKSGIERRRISPKNLLPPTGQDTRPLVVEDRCTVALEIERVSEDGSQRQEPCTFEFTVGEGLVAEGLETGVMGLGACEEIELRIESEFCLPDVSTKFELGSESTVTLRVKLMKVSPPPPCSDTLLIHLAQARKEVGTSLLTANRLRRAYEKYWSGASLLLDIDTEGGRREEETKVTGSGIEGCPIEGAETWTEEDASPENSPTLLTVLTSLLLNAALAALKLHNFQDAEDACNKALHVSPDNVKAFFRRGSARLGLGKLDAAREDLLRAQELDSGVSGQVRSELQRMGSLSLAAKEQDSQRCKKMFHESSELYSPSERALTKDSFPCSKELVAMDLQEIYDEIDEEEEQAEALAAASKAMRRGQQGASLGPISPWDRDGRKSEAELYDHTVQEMVESERKQVKDLHDSGEWMKNHPHHHTEWLRAHSKDKHATA